MRRIDTCGECRFFVHTEGKKYTCLAPVPAWVYRLVADCEGYEDREDVKPDSRLQAELCECAEPREGT